MGSPEMSWWTGQASTSSTAAPAAVRWTDSQPFFAAALVSYASSVATTWPLLP